MRVKNKTGFCLAAIVFFLLTGMLAGKDVQAAEKKVAQMSLGDRHSAAIASDGSLWMWGDNSKGALGNGKKGNKESLGTPVKIMDGVSQVSLGDGHSGAVKKDGSLWMWGSNNYGQLGDGTTTDRLKPKKIMDGVSQVILCGDRSAAVMRDGRLMVWGRSTNSNLGLSSENSSGPIFKKPQKLMDDVVQADMGCSHGGAVKKDGTLWMWGHNEHGQLGIGTQSGGVPKQVAGMSDIKQLSLGYMHSGVVKNDGSLWMWGHNSDGELGDNKSDRKIREPKKIMDGVSQISLGTWQSGILKKDGSVWMCGYNTFISFRSSIPKKITGGAKFIELCSSRAAIIKTDSSLWTWGYGPSGSLGAGNMYGDKAEKPVRISVGGTAKPSNPGTGQQASLPRKNSIFSIQNVTYKVTNSDAQNGTVALTKGDSSKTSAAIPATVKKNGYTFKVTQISSKAFYKNTKLKKVALGKNITSIGARAFAGCTSLETVSLGNGLVKIGDYAFSGCKNLAKVTVPAKVKTIGTAAFSGDGRLKNIQVKSAVLNQVGKRLSAASIKRRSSRFRLKSSKITRSCLRTKDRLLP